MLQIPKGGRVLSVGRQGPLPYVWVEVDPTVPSEPRIFRSVTTGEWFNDERLVYVGHVKLGGGPEPWYEMFLYEVATELIQKESDPIDARFHAERAELADELVELYGPEALVAS